MKHGKRFTTLAVALALVCGLVIGANAAGTSQQIMAYLTPGRTVKYNGEVQTMKDANGNPVYPISYNGTTYIPIRAVGNMLGIGVDWDANTQSVLLGDSGNGVDLIETLKPYVSYSKKVSYDAIGPDKPVFIQNADKQSRNIGGESVSHWIGLNVPSGSWATDPCCFNLGGKYTTLTFKVYAEADMTLYVKGDNDGILGQYALKGKQVPQTITVDLKSTTQLSFNVEKISSVKYSGSGRYYTFIFGASLK